MAQPLYPDGAAGPVIEGHVVDGQRAGNAGGLLPEGTSSYLGLSWRVLLVVDADGPDCHVSPRPFCRRALLGTIKDPDVLARPPAPIGGRVSDAYRIKFVDGHEDAFRVEKLDLLHNTAARVYRLPLAK